MSTLLEVGRPLPIATTAELPQQLVCTQLAQRNWSRVGLAVAEGDGSRQYFLKQSVDRRGQWQEDLWRNESAGTELAVRAIGDLVCVPRVIASDRASMLHVFEYRAIETPDELLRRDEPAFVRALPGALESMVAVIDALSEPQGLGESAGSGLAGLPVKERPFGGPPNALNFKGFEIRNCGFVTDPGADGVASEELVLFDFGRPYLAPREELASKLLVSIGLLNWGNPLGRFVRGPQTDWLELAREALGDRVDRGSALAELELQRSFRTREFKASNVVEAAAKGLVVRTLGGRYMGALERWIEGRL